MMKKKFTLRVKAGGRRRGSSLVEMLIAIIVLAVVLLGVLAGVMIARSSLEHKTYENARELALRVLEWAEAVPLSEDFGGADGAVEASFGKVGDDGRKFGDLTFDVARSPDATPDGISAEITVTIMRISDSNKVIIPPVKREVSVSGYKNVGEFKKDE